MHPSSRRVGPTSARNSASSKDSCPSRAFNKTMSVTASFGSLPALDVFTLREALLLTRRPLLPARRPPTDLFARFAIKPGLYRNTTETPAPNTIATRNCHPEPFCGVRDPLFGGAATIATKPSYFSPNFLPAFKLSKFKIVFSTNEYVPRVSPR